MFHVDGGNKGLLEDTPVTTRAQMGLPGVGCSLGTVPVMFGSCARYDLGEKEAYHDLQVD